MSGNVYSDTLHDKFILEVQLSNKKIVQQLIYNYIYTLNVSNFARKTLQKKIATARVLSELTLISFLSWNSADAVKHFVLRIISEAYFSMPSDRVECTESVGQKDAKWIRGIWTHFLVGTGAQKRIAFYSPSLSENGNR